MYMNININIVRNIVISIHIFTCIKLIRTKMQTKVRAIECSNWHLKYFLRMFYRKSNQNSVTSELQRHMAAWNNFCVTLDKFRVLNIIELVAKNPQACLWDKSHIYLHLIIYHREIDYTSLSKDRNLPLMWS